MDQRAIRDFLTKLNELQRRQVRYRQGVVTDDSPLSVALGGSDVSYTGVAALPDTYTVGDPVAVLMFDRDMLVLGVVNGPPPSGGSSDGAPHTIQDEGSSLTQRSVLDFAGSGVTAADAGGKTVVTIPGATGLDAAGVKAILASLDAGVDIIAWEKVGTSDDLATIYTVVTAGTDYATVDSDGFGTVYADIDDGAWTLERAGGGVGPFVTTSTAVYPGLAAGQAAGRSYSNRIYYRPGETARENSRTSMQVLGYAPFSGGTANGTDKVCVKRLTSGDMLLVGKAAFEITHSPLVVGLDDWTVYEWISATSTITPIATIATAASGNAAGHYIRVQQVGNVLTMEQWTGDPAGAGTLVESSTYTLTGSMATKFGTGVTGKGGVSFDQADAYYDNYLRESATPVEARELWVSVTDELGVTTARKVLDADGLSDLGHLIKDEGSALTRRPILDFVGSGVTATDDSANGKTVVTIPGAATPKYQTVQDEGTGLTQRAAIDFAGAGVTATDDAANDRTLVTIPGGGGGSAHTIQDEGSALTARSDLDFQGAGVTATDDAANAKTVVTIPGAAGSLFTETFASLASYTAVLGSGLAASGGALAVSSTSEQRITRNSLSAADAAQMLKITPGAVGANQVNAALMKYLNSNDLLMMQVFTSGTIWALQIAKYDGGAASALVTDTATGVTATAAVPVWAVSRILGNDVVVEVWSNDPRLGGTPARTLRHTLAGANATKYGDGVSASLGIRVQQTNLTTTFDDHCAQSMPQPF